MHVVRWCVMMSNVGEQHRVKVMHVLQIADRWAFSDLLPQTCCFCHAFASVQHRHTAHQVKFQLIINHWECPEGSNL